MSYFLIKIKSFYNFIFLSIGGSLNSILGFFINIFLAKNLSLFDYGIFVSAWVTIAILKNICFFGLKDFLIKEFGETKTWGQSLIKNSFKVVCIYTILSVLILMFIIVFSVNNYERLLLLLLGSQLFAFTAIEILTVFFISLKKTSVVSIIHTANYFVSFCLLLIMSFFYKTSLVSTGVVFLASSFIIILSSVYIILNHPALNNLKRNTKYSVLKIIKSSTPFGLGVFFQLIYYQSDQVMLRYFDIPENVAKYALGYAFLSGFFVIPSIIYQKFIIPKMYFSISEKEKEIYFKTKKKALIMLIIGLIVTCLALMAIKPVLTLLFGDKYEDSIIIFKLLSINIPILYSAYSFGAFLYMKDLIRKKVSVMGFTALLNITLNFFLIPIMSFKGAVLSTILCNAILLILYIVIYQNEKKHYQFS